MATPEKGKAVRRRRRRSSRSYTNILHLTFSKGTHHLWSIPISSFQDITYHFRVSLSVSHLSYHYDNHGVLSSAVGLVNPYLYVLFIHRAMWVVPEMQTPRHSLNTISSLRAAVCETRDIELQLHIVPLWLFFWWDYCTLFLEIFKRNCIVSVSPCVSIKVSLLAVITGIQQTFDFVCLWKRFEHWI